MTKDNNTIIIIIIIIVIIYNHYFIIIGRRKEKDAGSDPKHYMGALNTWGECRQNKKNFFTEWPNNNYIYSE